VLQLGTTRIVKDEQELSFAAMSSSRLLTANNPRRRGEHV
jgi:hypothetical protein